MNGEITRIQINEQEIYKIFSNISKDDVYLLGLNRNNFHPKNLVIHLLPVLPPVSRPYVMADGITCDDDLTLQYLEIIKANIHIGNLKLSEFKKQKFIQILENLPNECGMANLVSNDKGCYPGQEVHARLESRGKTVKRLCLLTGEAPISPGKFRLSNGSPVHISSCESSDNVSYGIAKLRVDDIETGYVSLDGVNWKVEPITYL